MCLQREGRKGWSRKGKGRGEQREDGGEGKKGEEEEGGDGREDGGMSVVGEKIMFCLESPTRQGCRSFLYPLHCELAK